LIRQPYSRKTWKRRPLAAAAEERLSDWISAGAIADGNTVARARALDLDPADFLRRNDSYNFF